MKLSVVGSINMDLTVTAERIPQKGETLRGSSIHYIPGGKGANQAVAMARLGANVQMFGCVGDDDNGKRLLENLSAEGVNTDCISVSAGVPTGLALITVGERDNTIVVVAGANDTVDCAYIDKVQKELLQSDVVVLQHEIPEETVAYVISLCAAHGVKTVLNPAPARKLSQKVIEEVSYLTPNEHEAKTLFGDVPFKELLLSYPEKLVVTRGAKGVSAARADGEVLDIPARPAVVVDTTGAGDTLNGAFAVMAARGVDFKDALIFANTAAGLSVQKFGAQGGMPTLAEVERAMDEMGAAR
jgi:ribokinase